MRNFLLLGAAALLVLIIAAACAGDEDTPTAPAPTAMSPAPTATMAAESKPETPPEPTSPAATMVSEPEATPGGEAIKIQFSCINRTVNTCKLVYQDFIERVNERSGGELELQLTSYPELGIHGQDALRLVKDGTLEFTEIYSGYVGSDFPIMEMPELLGLFPDAATQNMVLQAVRGDEIRLIRDIWGGEVLFYGFYPNQFFWSKRPLNSLEDFKGLKTRTHSVPLADLAAGLGADPQVMAFAEVYTALERGILEGAVTNPDAGIPQKWHEVTKYLVGPIKAKVHTLQTMNKGRWDSLPAHLQQILREEGARAEAENLRLADVWDQEGIGNAEELGMEYSPFTPEMEARISETAINSILPNWVNRAGGYDTEAVRIYNEKVAPILGIEVTPDGKAKKIAMAAAPSGETVEIQFSCINRTVNTCKLVYQDFIERVNERSGGELELQLTSYPELGIHGQDALRLVKDGTLEFTEIYSGYVGSDFPIMEMPELLGLFPDAATQNMVLQAVRGDEIRLIRDIWGGEVLFYGFYPNQFFWSKRPLNSLEDFKGLKTRTHSVPLADLAAGLGADPQVMAFAEVYTALERGILEGAVTNPDAGIPQKWHEVTKYLVGPIKAKVHTLQTMNKGRWDSLPAHLQQILREEGARAEAENLRLADVWDQEGIGNAEELGMEYSPFTPEMEARISETAINSILPNWVNRAGGYDTEAVRIYNEKVAPILGIEVTPDGKAKKIQ